MTKLEERMTATRYGLAREVAYSIDHQNMTPEEALSECNIL